MLSDKMFYRLHRIFGLAGGLFILIITGTGSILVVDKQIDNLLNPAQTEVKVTGQQQPYSRLLAVVQQRFPGAEVRSIQWAEASRHEAVRVEVMAAHQRVFVHLNPYTGQLISAQDADATFVRRARELHENLLLEPVGGYIMGLAGLCLLGSVLTGAWYYRRSLLSVFTVGVRWKKPARIVYADMHKWLGVVALLFMFFMSATGIFFHWEQLERSFDKDESRNNVQTATVLPSSFPVDAALANTLQTLPDFRPRRIDFPKPGDTTLVIRGNLPGSIRLLGTYNVAATTDARTGEYISGFNARDAGLEYIAEHIFEELHFGRYGGWVSQVVYILLALATAIVTITGFTLWFLKRN